MSNPRRHLRWLAIRALLIGVDEGSRQFLINNLQVIHKRSRRTVLLAAMAVVCLLGICCTSVRGANNGNGIVYRIGWEESPPFQTKGATGAATGFAVQLVQEAARRRGIRLQWVFSPKSSEASLREGLVDLWPLMTITADRRKVLHITDPYVQHDHYLVVAADSSYSKPQELFPLHSHVPAPADQPTLCAPPSAGGASDPKGVDEGRYRGCMRRPR